MPEKEEKKQQTANKKQFVIQKIFTKDLSFETPNSPKIFLEKWEPEVKMQMGNTAVKIDEGIHEVTLSITVTAKLGEKTAYLAEVQQAGIFTIQGYEQKEVAAMLGSYCPNVLFPFARETVSDLVVKGGFPQLLLSPINFDALYAEYVQAKDQKPMKYETKH